ncbi:murein DD-endopeptidase MepM/ murein hydrolase activator NlpD [Streptomyces calvus]|uniref:M23 family metallopeptidase n=1 Tax=Streptomyces calvus TaxID=67282 RepID=UPI0035168ABD
MRANRCARTCTRVVLLVILTPAALLAPPPAPLAAVATVAPAGRNTPTEDTPAADTPTADLPPGDVPDVGRAWPVGTRPPVLRGWEPPATTYGRGHRGVDLAAAPGTPVRAVADGRISYAGRVAGRGVVSVELAGTGDPPLRTTYEPVKATAKAGDTVTAGDIIGTVETGGSHCTLPCLHWGLRKGDTYLDPLTLLPPWLTHRGPSRLLPVLGVPLPG